MVVPGAFFKTQNRLRVVPQALEPPLLVTLFRFFLSFLQLGYQSFAYGGFSRIFSIVLFVFSGGGFPPGPHQPPPGLFRPRGKGGGGSTKLRRTGSKCSHASQPARHREGEPLLKKVLLQADRSKRRQGSERNGGSKLCGRRPLRFSIHRASLGPRDAAQ